MNRKIPAFTLMELTMAMLIAAIAIGITYSIYVIVLKNYGSYHHKSEQMAAVLRLDELLKKDFERSRQVIKTDDGLRFYKDSMMVNYSFQPDMVIRNGGIIDSFKFANQSRAFLYEGQEVQANSDTAALLDELRFNLIFNKDSLTLHYHKTYSAENLITRKN